MRKYCLNCKWCPEPADFSHCSGCLESPEGFTNWEEDKPTKLDKIKEMTAEELADWIYNTVDDFPPWCDESRGHHNEAGGCEKCMVDWLKEAENG